MKKIISAIALMSCTLSSFAVTAQSGVYFGPLLGWTSPTRYTDSSMQNATGISTSHSNKNFTWGGFAGYEQAFTQHFLAGIEFDYINFGKTNYNFSNGQSTNYGNYGIETLLTATYLNHTGISLFAKGGVAAQTETSSTATIGNVTFTGDRAEAFLSVLGAGVGYALYQGTTFSTNINLQYQHIFGNNETNLVNDLNVAAKPQSQNVVLVGLTLKFPNQKR